MKEHSDSKYMYSEDDIIKMLEFLVDNIFVVFIGVTLKIDPIEKLPARSFFNVKKWPPVTFKLLKYDRGSLFNRLESLFNVEKWPFFAGVII